MLDMCEKERTQVRKEGKEGDTGRRGGVQKWSWGGGGEGKGETGRERYRWTNKKRGR